jgi:hypothetical protein
MSGPVRWPVWDEGLWLPGTDSPCFPDRRRRWSTANSRGLRPVPCAVRLTSVRAPAVGGSLSSLTVRGPAGAPVKPPNPQEAAICRWRCQAQRGSWWSPSRWPIRSPSSGASASAASRLAVLAGDQQEPPRRDEVLDRASARVVTGPGPYALLTTGALIGADERARHRRSLRQALVSQQRRGTDPP